MEKIRTPQLTENEKIILSEQGGYASHLRSGWKLGHFYLTNKRLLFCQSGSIKFETSINNIIQVTMEKRFFVLSRKDVISITYRYNSPGRLSKAWIIIANLESWYQKIYGMSMLNLDEETINRITQELDADSSEILWYFWYNQHAKLDELAEHLQPLTPMDILLKIKKIINPTAERIFGIPILTFEESKIDHETGEKILFSWWLLGEERLKEKDEKMQLDIFDEGDYINVVMGLPGVREEDIELKIEKNELVVAANTLDRKYYKQIELPTEVNPEGLTKIYNNDILQIRLGKKLKFSNEN